MPACLCSVHIPPAYLAPLLYATMKQTLDGSVAPFVTSFASFRGTSSRAPPLGPTARRRARDVRERAWRSERCGGACGCARIWPPRTPPDLGAQVVASAATGNKIKFIVKAVARSTISLVSTVDP